MLLTIIKAIAEIGCVIGSEVIVGGIVKNASSPSKNKALDICSKLAAGCLGGVLGAAAGQYADECIDEAANVVQKLTNKAGEEDGAA